MSNMTDAQWADLKGLALSCGAKDEHLFALAVGCPEHGNGNMDFEMAGFGLGIVEVFCHSCEVAA